MEILTEEIASLIVDETVKRTRSNINIMNYNGVIIASYNKKRIGNIHYGAKRAIELERTITLTETDCKYLAGTQPGINLPIIFHDELVGVIGLTGNPQQLMQIADVVKMSTELLLSQSYFTYELEGNIRSQELLIEELLKGEPSKTFIRYLTQQLNVELLTLRKCIIVDIEKQIFSKNSIVRMLSNKMNRQSFVIAFTNYNRIVILVTDDDKTKLNDKITRIYQVFMQLNLAIEMASSLVFTSLNDFKKAYEECELVFLLNEHEQSVVSFEDVEAQTLLYQINSEIRTRYKKRILANIDNQTIKTLQSFFEHNLNITQTAKALYIHRNTLLYRLTKCQQVTGLDPRIYNDAVKLQLAMWC
ncbi:helix-turn-helix domain-containing protein [Staphylococcus sp. ACRSN]|uniref:CdaR family transcriptional regulator n=1 Tax=Staphylococcus sp. ACRSN TaxID=2918214 RepID=UPI001EF2A42D|nr:sugar diacid recognition domain-containing protein [Staphylococcus sp. ACRSN]MCG7339147.1 helix-turn-helix domain-containing protein [Staphylococcus sp. ACRSN]